MKFWEERVWKSYCGVCGCGKFRKKAKIAPIGTEKYLLWCKGIKYNIDEQMFFFENAGWGKKPLGGIGIPPMGIALGNTRCVNY